MLRTHESDHIGHLDALDTSKIGMGDFKPRRLVHNGFEDVHIPRPVWVETLEQEARERVGYEALLEAASSIYVRIKYLGSWVSYSMLKRQKENLQCVPTETLRDEQPALAASDWNDASARPCPSRGAASPTTRPHASRAPAARLRLPRPSWR
jgi:hypothetical protein